MPHSRHISPIRYMMDENITCKFFIMHGEEMETSVDLMVMSGVEDGRLISLSSANGEGKQEDGAWVIRLGRREDNDVWLRFDNFASRYHARLHRRESGWWLEDCNSKNHTYVETGNDDDAMVSGTVPIQEGQLFRVGRTWFRIQVTS